MVERRDAVRRNKQKLIANRVEITHLAARRKWNITERSRQKSVIHGTTSIAYAIISQKARIHLIVVRKLVEDDAAPYWSLRLEALEREPRSFGMTPAEHRLITLEEIVTQILKPGSFFVGAFDGETLVGIARFAREPREKESHKGHVYGVYVTASHRGRGIARSLIATIIAEIKSDPSCEQLLLSVGTFNTAARAAYLAMGFVPYGIEPRALKAGDEYIDEEHMCLRLS